MTQWIISEVLHSTAIDYRLVLIDSISLSLYAWWHFKSRFDSKTGFHNKVELEYKIRHVNEADLGQFTFSWQLTVISPAFITITNLWHTHKAGEGCNLYSSYLISGLVWMNTCNSCWTNRRNLRQGHDVWCLLSVCLHGSRVTYKTAQRVNCRWVGVWPEEELTDWVPENLLFLFWIIMVINIDFES